MAKIAVSIPDSTLKKIDGLSNTKGITRSKYVSMALDFYSNGAENFKNDNDRLNSELTAKTKELESLSEEVLPLREKFHTLSNTFDDKDKQLAERIEEVKSLSIKVLQLEDQIHTLSNTLTDKENAIKEKDREVGSKANDVFQRDKKIHTLENQIAEKDKRIESLSKEVLLAKEEGMKSREELDKARTEATKYEMAFKSQQSDIEFLRGHVAQLTQQISVLALPPAKEEESKKKGWWHFWK
jgi:chromosome segregation ATPase